MRLTTGGTTGGTIACAACNHVASGLFDVVMCVGWEKQEEGHTTTGITAMADPLWGRRLQTGAISGMSAAQMIREFGERAELAAAQVRVIAGDNAARNPYAHLRMRVTVDDVRNSRLLVYPLRLLHMCPESNGACALIMASEEKAKKITEKPVWYKDHVTTHMEGMLSGVAMAGGGTREEVERRAEWSSMRVCSRKLFKRNGITDPLKEIDLFEMYDPAVWWQLEWLDWFLLLERGAGIKMVEDGVTALDGAFPVNPSGGVITTNPIGATSTIRIAEAALQVRGDAGEHQVAKEVKTAMASSFGGTLWTILHLLTKERPE
jgi:acetyl-CoA C-acetyltransferase